MVKFNCSLLPRVPWSRSKLQCKFGRLTLIKVKKLLSDGGGVEERYMSETITHAIADDCEADDYSEAKELFELTVVTVSVIRFRGFAHVRLYQHRSLTNC